MNRKQKTKAEVQAEAKAAESWEEHDVAVQGKKKLRTRGEEVLSAAPGEAVVDARVVEQLAAVRLWALSQPDLRLRR